MRIIDNEMTVRDGVAQPDEAVAIPHRQQSVGIHQRIAKLTRLVRGRPFDGRVEPQQVNERNVPGFAVGYRIALRIDFVPLLWQRTSWIAVNSADKL